MCVCVSNIDSKRQPSSALDWVARICSACYKSPFVRLSSHIWATTNGFPSLLVSVFANSRVAYIVMLALNSGNWRSLLYS